MRRTLGTIFFSALLLLALSGCLRGRLRDERTVPPPATAASEPAAPTADPFWQEWEALSGDMDAWLDPEPTVGAGDIP